MKYILTLILTIFAFNASAEYSASGGGWTFYNSTGTSNGYITMCGTDTSGDYCDTWKNTNGSLGESTNTTADIDIRLLTQIKKAKAETTYNSSVHINLQGTVGTSASEIAELDVLLHDSSNVYTYNTTLASKNHRGYVSYDFYNHPGTAFKVNYEDGIITNEFANNQVNSSAHETLLAGYYMVTKFPTTNGQLLMDRIVDTKNADGKINLSTALSYSPPASD